MSSACTSTWDAMIRGDDRCTPWEPMGADGSTAEYERICDELWGPRSLYLLSVVTPQKPITVRMKGEDGQTIPISTDIGQAPKGQRRAVLRQLLGLGAYQAASRSAEGACRRARAGDRESRQTKPRTTTLDAERVDAEWPKEWRPACEHGSRERQSPSTYRRTRADGASSR